MKFKENFPLIIIISVLLLALFISFKFFQTENTNGADSKMDTSTTDEQINEQVNDDDLKNSSKEMTTYDYDHQVELNKKLQQQTQIDKNILAKNFKMAIEQMNTCLDLKANPGEDNQEITTDLLNSLIKGEVGEVIMKNEEISETYLKKSDSEKFKIKLEMDYSGQNAITRKLEYSIQNPQGSWIAQELTQDQKEDPTDTLINSFLNDGEIYHEQKKTKYYFQNGEDLIAQTSDGLITDFELFHISKKIHCSSMATEQMKCLCD